MRVGAADTRFSFVSMRRRLPLLLSLGALAALAAPAVALAASKPPPARQPVSKLGSLKQLSGRAGCVVARSKTPSGCARARALNGPAPFLGSHAIAVSPDGKNVYVASSSSNAITIFKRNASTGALTQATGAAGCIAARGQAGFARAIALRHPNSVAVSPDGKTVYATSLGTNSVVALRRNRSTGALTQLRKGAGCIANAPTPGCTTGTALDGPDVVAVSPDGANVYVGSFVGSSLAVFSRNTSTGALTQLSGAAGCLVQTPVSGCTTALALSNPEGVAVSPDGQDVYVAAPGSGALDTFTRASGGALTQATDGTGCTTDTEITGCTLGTQLDGADAVAVSPNNVSVYVTSLLSNAVASFSRSPTGQLTQLTGTSACVINVLAVGCGLGRQLSGPEGLAVSPDSASLYVAAYKSGALGVFNRDTGWGAVTQKTRPPGCLAIGVKPGCLQGRALRGASSVAVSPDGKSVYTAAFASNAVSIFRRVTGAKTR
jgi:DNA-binding beta-propeller fold protein YncE